MVMPSRIGQTRYSPQDLTKTVSQFQAVKVYEGVLVLGKSDHGGRTCCADVGHGRHVFVLRRILAVIRLDLAGVGVICGIVRTNASEIGRASCRERVYQYG